MQIKAITVNAAGMAAEQRVQGKIQQEQPVGSVFGPECKVTISQEGRNLSRQQTDQAKQSAQSFRAEQKLFRQQEEAEREQKTNEGYREQLEKIEKNIDSLSHSYKAEADKSAVEKEQEVLSAMRSQKQAQMEENQRRAKEAQQMAMQSAKYQEEIDENNRDILTLLKSLEEAEKSEEDQEYTDVSSEGSAGGGSGTEHSASGMIQDSAAQFMAASVERDLSVGGMLTGLSDEGHQRLGTADAIAQNMLKESESIRAALDDEAFTDDERAKLMEDFQERAGANALDAQHSREQGLHILQAAREYKIKHIADDPLRGMQETKKSMMLSAVDAAIGEAVQGSLAEASQELKDQVEELIDERNDVDRIPQDDEDNENNEEEQDGQMEALEGQISSY